MIVLQKTSECCGCSACVEICPKQCISLESDKEGFWYPKTNTDVCVNCHLCEKVCPVITPNPERKPLCTLAAINTDENIRMHSASGGIFTIIAERILEEGGVVFGVKFDENWNVVFGYSETKGGLEAFRRSKYVQAWVGESFTHVKRFLKDGRKVLFSGVPCQIAGLKRFLGRDYDNLILLDVICEGVPSPKLWEKYLRQEYDRCVEKSTEVILEKNVPYSIKDISFRDKTMGWKNFSFAILFDKVACRDGVKRTIKKHIDRKSAYMQLMFRYGSLRPICYVCPFKSGKSGSDITIADYWGIEKLCPEMDDNKGTSMILINTEKGRAYCDVKKMRYAEMSYEDALPYNNIVTSVKKPSFRDSFFSKIDSGKDIIGLMTNARPPLSKRIELAIKRRLRACIVSIFGECMFNKIRIKTWGKKR